MFSGRLMHSSTTKTKENALRTKLFRAALGVGLGIVLLVGIGSTPASAAGPCFRGAYKDTVNFGGEWHHYVAFRVNLSATDDKWFISKRPGGFPFKASLWSGYYQYHHNKGGSAVYKEVGYQWAGNLPDPYSPSSWEVCIK